MCTLNCTLKINRVLLICCVLTVSFGVKSKSTVLSSVTLGLTGDFLRERESYSVCKTSNGIMCQENVCCNEF